MRARFGIVLFSLLLISGGLRGAYDPLMGVWKLSLGKGSSIRPSSKYAPGYPVPQSQTCKFEPSGADGVKYTSDTVEADGKPAHVEYTAQLDGKDYPVKGDPNCEMVSLKRVKPFVTEVTCKKGGEVTGSFSILIWGNGQLMTITSKETRGGKTYDNITIYDKQLGGP